MDLVPQTETVWFREVEHDDFEYGRILADAWEKAVGLAVIEQDIVVRKDVVDAFLNCEHEWCCFVYPWTVCIGPAMGCSRWAASFQERYPDAMEEALQLPGGHGPGHFRSVDFVLFRDVLAGKYGEQPHCHLPPVEHLSDRQALQPDVDSTPLLEIPSWYGAARSPA